MELQGPCEKNKFKKWDTKTDSAYYTNKKMTYILASFYSNRIHKGKENTSEFLRIYLIFQ